jgi:hypothetical protein
VRLAENLSADRRLFILRSHFGFHYRVSRWRAPASSPQADAELAQHLIIGPGLVHRCAADLQRRFLVTARKDAEITGEPRNLPRRVGA